MHRLLATLLELALIGGSLTLAAGCSGDDTTDAETTESPTAGGSTAGCPTATGDTGMS